MNLNWFFWFGLKLTFYIVCLHGSNNQLDIHCSHWIDRWNSKGYTSQPFSIGFIFLLSVDLQMPKSHYTVCLPLINNIVWSLFGVDVGQSLVYNLKSARETSFIIFKFHTSCVHQVCTVLFVVCPDWSNKQPDGRGRGNFVMPTKLQWYNVPRGSRE